MKTDIIPSTLKIVASPYFLREKKRTCKNIVNNSPQAAFFITGDLGFHSHSILAAKKIPKQSHKKNKIQKSVCESTGKVPRQLPIKISLNKKKTCEIS